ncbi:hypothetical protein PSECIP111854_01612 [Pseudoalteromonas sp. CIP111854]|uniref:Uncharacterized protein n=1 Tax=Pseudoalteromonas holothuriae TaxID=2963714 RepID=A0A9W4QVW4_9GAMM|nr:hypothetical protein [Pseudoalteromonas sp. CIP111854]CAH9055608.1 hypothetical protein PSECIP111854_01612 [Pseudoalteromonas sp. CIP111854]
MDNQALQISNAAPSNTGQNLEKLRQQGMTKIQQFAPLTWTDHNRFDPGVTVLEVLVYVLSDLSYKLDYPVPELLAQPHSEGSVKFYEPEQVLFSHCVTEDDYRRLILDLLDVKNVHVMSHQVAGSSTTILDFQVLLYAPDDDKKTNVTALVNQAFSLARCVNHRLGDITFYDISKVTVGMTLSLQHVDNLVALLTELYILIGREISPDIPKYSAQQLLRQGMSIGQIYQGPKLQHGFVLDEDLHKSAYSVSLFSSNILSVLHGHESIERVNAFRFSSQQDSADGNYNAQDGYEFWQIQFGSDDSAQRVNIAQLGFDEEHFFDDLSLLIDGQSYQLTEQDKAAIRQGLQVLNHPPELTSSVMLPKFESAQYLALSDYRSLQHELPQVFAVGEQTLDADIDSAQKAQLMQFKGYLQLFDQILADQHKQLDVLPDILSLPPTSLFEGLGKLLDSMLASESLNSQQVDLFWQQACALPHSQLSQALTNISGIEHLLNTDALSYWQRGMQRSLENDFSIAQLTRLNHSVDHLLARFAERSVDSNLLKYQAVFSFYAPSLSNEADPSPAEPLLERLVLLRQYIDKCRLLSEISHLGQNRCRGYDYLSADVQLSQCSAMAKGIMRRLGLSHPAHMPLATHNRESFYLVEGSLLQSEYFSALERAQLSNSLYFVLPDWTTRFACVEFRQFAERKIRELTPLHMPVHCLWLDRETMSLFERLYYGWLNYFSQTQRERFELSNASVTAIEQQLSKLLGQFFTSHIPLEPNSGPIWPLSTVILTHQADKLGLWDEVKETMVEILLVYCDDDSVDEFVIDGQTSSDIYRSVNTNIDAYVTYFPTDFSADDIFYLSAQHYIDEICRPSISDHVQQDKRLTIGYSPLAYLKPLYPVSISTINSRSTEQSKFIVAHSKPNRI